MTDLLTMPIDTLAGAATTLGDLTASRAALIVNVASRCGLTPQYAQLEALQEEFGDRGFIVIGVPCNQFGGQEPGSAEEIATFCSTTYGVSFPLTAKVAVNGPERHPVYELLTTVANERGEAGDIKWNFEKFVISPEGDIVARFRPKTEPNAPEVRAAIESVLPN